MTTTVKINGEEVELDSEDLEFSGNLSRDMEQIATHLNRTGELWAEAEEQSINIDAAYRQWRAKEGFEVLTKEPKLAEWKVNQAIESSEDFVTYKTAIARAKKVALTLKNRFASLDKKASALQSRGAMLRSELDSTNMGTPKRSNPVTSDKKRKVKAALSK